MWPRVIDYGRVYVVLRACQRFVSFAPVTVFAGLGAAGLKLLSVKSRFSVENGVTPF
jgi:hypothetical protein